MDNSKSVLQRGFTLIEMLLAMSLLAVILAMAYQGLRTGTRVVERGEALVDRTNRLRLVQQFLRTQLSRAMPLMLEARDGGDEIRDFVVFEGDDEQMRFVAPMPGYLGHGGPHEQILMLERGNDGLELLFAHRLLASNEEGDLMRDRDFPPIVLLDGIERGTFEYLTLDDEGMPTEWVDEWEETTAIPVMIRIALDMQAGMRLVWPDMDIAPALDSGVVRARASLPSALPGPRDRERHAREQARRQRLEREQE